MVRGVIQVRSEHSLICPICLYVCVCVLPSEQNSQAHLGDDGGIAVGAPALEGAGCAGATDHGHEEGAALRVWTLDCCAMCTCLLLAVRKCSPMAGFRAANAISSCGHNKRRGRGIEGALCAMPVR